MKWIGLLMTWALMVVVVTATYRTVTAPIIAETGELWRGIADALSVN